MKQILKFLNRQIPFLCKLLTLTLVPTRTTELFAGWLHSTDIKLMKSSRFSPTINDWQFSPFCVLHFGKSLTYRRPDYFALLWLNCGHIKMWECWSHKHDVEVPKIRTSSTSRWNITRTTKAQSWGQWWNTAVRLQQASYQRSHWPRRIWRCLYCRLPGAR